MTLHPLRKYPGPFWWRLTRIPWVRAHVKGQLPFEVYRMHEKYGPVVRIAPDELSFLTLTSWKEIYGHRVGSTMGAAGDFAKHEATYRQSKSMAPSVLSAQRELHTMLRRRLANGFSEKAMREQEPIIRGYANLLMQRLYEMRVDATTGAEKAVDLCQMYNFFTFDVIGDLAMGEAFGCLADTTYHPWVKSVFTSVKDLSWMTSAKLLGLDFVVELMLHFGQKARRFSTELTLNKLKKRMKYGMGRPDFIEGLLKDKDQTVRTFLPVSSSLAN